MYPVLFQIAGFTVHTYGVLVASGILLGLWLSRQRATQMGLDGDRVWSLGIYMILAGLAGSKLWYMAESAGYYIENPAQIFSVNTLQAAGVFYGGFLGALLTGVLYMRWAGLPALPVLDAYSAPVALGHAMGRLGCFSAGCCYGRATDAAWGVTFRSEYAAGIVGVPLGVPLHPTQLYEAAAEMVNFLVLVWLGTRPAVMARPGRLFAAYLMIYGLIRGANEFFRGDPGRTLLPGGFSLMQVVSLGLLVVGAVLWLRASRK
jgi:phosphatidylglycerol:prolipoprotein diacylglycerol transferase